MVVSAHAGTDVARRVGMKLRSLVFVGFCAAAPVVSVSGCDSPAAQSGAAGDSSASGPSSSGNPLGSSSSGNPMGSSSSGAGAGPTNGGGLCAGTLPSSATPMPTATSEATCTSNVPVQVVAGGGAIFALAVDGKNVYWSVCGEGLNQVAVTGGTPLVLATGSVMAIAVDALSVYWADAGGSIRKVPIGGGAASVIALGAGHAGESRGGCDERLLDRIGQGAGERPASPPRGRAGGGARGVARGSRIHRRGRHRRVLGEHGNGDVNKVPIGGGVVAALAVSLSPGGTFGGGGATTTVAPSGPRGWRSTPPACTGPSAGTIPRPSPTARC